MRVKCETCEEEFEIPDDQFDTERDYYCGKECKSVAGENILRAVFGEPKRNPKMGKRIKPGPTEEELEFLGKEVELMVKNHRMEDSEKAVENLFQMTKEMIDRGVVANSPEGVGKAWEMIFREHPDMKGHFEKFNSVLYEEFLKEMKQGERPH